MSWLQVNNAAFKIKILDYTYTSEPEVNTALPLKRSSFKLGLFVIACVLSLGFFWLLAKWSDKRQAIFLFVVCSLEEATHMLIEEEDDDGSTIVPKISKYDMREARVCLGFEYRDRTYLYSRIKEVFSPIRYVELGKHLDQLRKDKYPGNSEHQRQHLLSYYGDNVMRLPVQSLWTIFVSEMLTPYQVFQSYGMILWIYERYYLFTIILLIYSLYNYWKTATEVRRNQEKLAFESYFDVQCKVLTREEDGVELCTDPIKQTDQHKSTVVKDQFNGVVQDPAAAQMESERQRKEYTELQEQLQAKPGQHSHQHLTPRKQVSKQTPHSQKAYELVSNANNDLINNKNRMFQKISSHRLVPGDIIILHEGDIVPCDCVLLRGEALVCEKYTTGQSYLVRKQEMLNFVYISETEESYLLYLGTDITKIKNHEADRRSKDQFSVGLQSIQNSIVESEPNELVCLVTQTNYNTLRGKFLRAIRYQKKHSREKFTNQTIYFIFIILTVTIIVFFIIFARIHQDLRGSLLVLLLADFIVTAIPPTLPTVMSVGINFVQYRLKLNAIHCVLPSTIFSCGRADTVILEGEKVFGSDCYVQSAAIGTRGRRGFGLIFTSADEFWDYELAEITFTSLDQLHKRTKERKEFFDLGTIFMSALSVCHTLEFLAGRIEGPVVEKSIYEFCKAINTLPNEYRTERNKIEALKILNFKKKEKLLGVLAELHHKISEDSNSKVYSEGAARVIFLKGSPERVLEHCVQESYPENSHDYVVDMSEKGFTLFCYAFKHVDHSLREDAELKEDIRKGQFIFLGFAIVQKIIKPENVRAMKSLSDAAMRVLLISEQSELQASSKAVQNGLCCKNQLLLCGLNCTKDKIYTRGHIEWVSTQNDLYHEFLTEFEGFSDSTKVSLTADLYEQIFMKRELRIADRLFNQTIVLNKMQFRQEKNLYSEMEKKGRVTLAVGGGGSLSECASVSLQLQRESSSLLSSFHTSSSSLQSIVDCLRICRAGLSTNFHCFSMMLLFSLTQFTTTSLLAFNCQTMNSTQTLYQDLILTFPIFVTINLTQPAKNLSKEVPPDSFFSLRNLISMLGQLLIQFTVQICFLGYMLSFSLFNTLKLDGILSMQANGTFSDSTQIGLAMFVLTNYLYLGIVLATSVSKPFRKPFYTNPYYTVNLIVVWIYNGLLVIYPTIALPELRLQNDTHQAQFILVLGMLVGNLTMLIMYLYENLLVWLWSYFVVHKVTVVNRNSLQKPRGLTHSSIVT